MRTTVFRVKEPPRNFIVRKLAKMSSRMADPLRVVKAPPIKNRGNANPLKDSSHLRCGSGKRWSIF
jgi:hypothetical protein